jgi:hypothetical protein
MGLDTFKSLMPVWIKTMSGAWRMVSMAGFMFEMLYVVLENDDV